MRVLQTVKYYDPSRGGMESVVKDIVGGISNDHEGVEFTVYSNNHVPTLNKSTLLLERIKVIKEITPIVFRSQPVNIFYWSLRKLIKDCDIIHHHYPFPNMELALLRHEDLLKDKKLIITWHANIKNSRWSFIQRYYNPIIRRLLERADHIVVTSPQLLEASDILGDYKDKVSVIPLSFSTSFANPNQEGKKLNSKRRKSILFVGKLRSYKGVKYLIEAIVGLDVNLIIVGTGEEEVSLKQQVDELNISSQVQFLKDVNDEELQALYQSTDLFVLPSINEAEAFGVVQLEAMSNGLPIINTNLKSGVPFVSLHEITGITIEPQNAIAISNAIQKILSDDELYNKLSTQCVERARLFTREVMADAYYNLYIK